MADKNAVKDLLSKALKAVDSMNESVKQTRETTPTTERASTANETTRTGSFRTELERLFPNVYGGVGNKKRSLSATDTQTSSRSKKRSTLYKKKGKTVLENSSV